MRAVAWFLLWAVRNATKAEPSASGVSVRGIPGEQSLSVWYGVACLFDEWGPPHEYGDTMKAVKGS